MLRIGDMDGWNTDARTKSVEFFRKMILRKRVAVKGNGWIRVVEAGKGNGVLDLIKGEMMAGQMEQAEGNNTEEVVQETDDKNILEDEVSVHSQEESRPVNIGDLCIAQWSEDLVWYNAQVEDILEDGSFNVYFIDYFNKATVKNAQLVKHLGDIVSHVSPDYIDQCVFTLEEKRNNLKDMSKSLKNAEEKNDNVFNDNGAKVIEGVTTPFVIPNGNGHTSTDCLYGEDVEGEEFLRSRGSAGSKDADKVSSVQDNISDEVIAKNSEEKIKSMLAKHDFEGSEDEVKGMLKEKYTKEELKSMPVEEMEDSHNLTWEEETDDDNQTWGKEKENDEENSARKRDLRSLFLREDDVQSQKHKMSNPTPTENTQALDKCLIETVRVRLSPSIEINRGFPKVRRRIQAPPVTLTAEK